MGSPHVEELPADLLALLLHAQLRCSGFRGELGEVLVAVVLEETHPAQVLHTLTERKIKLYYSWKTFHR